MTEMCVVCLWCMCGACMYVFVCLKQQGAWDLGMVLESVCVCIPVPLLWRLTGLSHVCQNRPF